MPVKIFFCYAHEDEPILNKLKAHLKLLQRQGLIDVWHDRDISAGTEWEREISKQLSEADVILLLISPDFMTSDYCYGVEMKRAMERYERGEACVIPVILRPVYWQGAPFARLQALPTDGKPVTDPDWYNLDRALSNVTEGIRKAIEKLLPPPIVQLQPFDLSLSPGRSHLNFFRKLTRPSSLVAALALVFIIIPIVFISSRLSISPPSPSAFHCPTSQQVSAWMKVDVSKVTDESCAFTAGNNGKQLSGVVCTSQDGGTTIEFIPVNPRNTVVVRACDGSQLPDIWGLNIRFVGGYASGDASVCAIARNARNNVQAGWIVQSNC